MKNPITAIREHIFVTDAGAPFALFTLRGMPYGLTSEDLKLDAHAKHMALYQRLTGDHLLLGLTGTISPADIADRMMEDVDAPTPEWTNEVALTVSELELFPAGVRHYFLIVPLTAGGASSVVEALNPQRAFLKLKRRAEIAAADFFGYARPLPADAEYRRWVARAAAVAKAIPTAFEPRPAGQAALRWILTQLCVRGTGTPGYLNHRDPVDTGWLTLPGLPEPMVDEGCYTDGLRRGDAFSTRVLKVQRDDTSAPSYQCNGVIGAAPHSGFAFPGAEFVNSVTAMPFDVDFMIQTRVTPADRVVARNRRAERNLRDQYNQRSSTADAIVGGTSELDRTAEQLAGYHAELTSSEQAVEVAATVCFTTYGPDAETARSRMEAIQDVYSSAEWIIDVPFGAQEQLFWDAWPGARRSRACADYTQITSGRFFAMGVPLASDELGARVGYRFATNITSGVVAPVFQALGSLTERDISAALAVVAELGAGKSVAMKTIAVHSYNRGGRLVIVDPSDNTEWAVMARGLADAVVLDFLNPAVSADPLRVLGPTEKGVRVALNFLTVLLGERAASDTGALLFNELDRIKDGELQIRSLAELREHLAHGDIDDQDRPLATSVARKLAVYANIDAGRAFFDPDLEPMRLDAPAIVFCTHGLKLPSTSEMNSEAARKEMSLDKIVGRAAYAYLADIGFTIGTEDDSQEVLFIVDEAHRMTGSVEGHETIKNGIKIGRKHKFVVLLGSHDAEELGDESLRELIPQRIVMRTRGSALAKKNLAWLDPSYAEDEEMLDLVTKDLSPMDENDRVPEERRGEALYRDHRNRIGKIKIQVPMDPTMARAVLTSPPKRSTTAA